MATITCRCAAVHIAFYTDEDLFRLQCCCHDCSGGLWYAHKRGGPAPPVHQCVDTSWFPNNFEILRGEDKIGAFLNFEEADTTRFYCTDCWTPLLGDHPAYEGAMIVTQVNNYVTFAGLQNATLMAPQARHFTRDVASEQFPDLPAWSGKADQVYQGVAELLMASFPSMLAAGGAGAEMNTQILLQRIGGTFVPDNEPRLSEGPATMRQQADNTTTDPNV